MKQHKRFILAILIAVGALAIRSSQIATVKAQSTPLTIVAQLAHTSCPATAAGKTQFCFATDGLWQSLNGAPYVQFGVGVVAFNGRSGIVVPAPGDYLCTQVTGCPATAVQTVNGKPGPAVTITANTTLQ